MKIACLLLLPITAAFTPVYRPTASSLSPSSLSVATDMFVDKTATHSATQEYYGKTLQKSEDLKTNACCTAGSPLDHIKEAISNIHPDVIAKYYGCGFCVPDEV